MRVLALPAAVSLLVAGCLGAPGGVDPALVPEVPGAPGLAAVRALLEGVPCEASEVGAGTSENLKQLARLDLTESAGRHGEADIHGDLLLHARHSEGGFDVVSIANPLAPRLLASFTEAPAPALEVKFSSDGLTGLVGHSDGIVLADLRDPANPVLENAWEFPPMAPTDLPPQNAHMLYTFVIEGQDYVFLAPNTNTGVWIMKLAGEPGMRTLEPVARFGELLNNALGPHDMWVTFDEDLQAPLLYVANGFNGWLVADVSDPASPQMLGGSLPLDPYQGYHHTIQAAKVGDRRLVATMNEVGANGLKVYDATDLRLPRLLATWSVGPAPLPPQHNLQMVGDKLYLAHYTHGVFVFDLAALPAAPVRGLWSPVAHYALDSPGTMEPLGFQGAWDVLVKDGIVYVGETLLGLHVVGYGCLAPGDAALTSTG